MIIPGDKRKIGHALCSLKRITCKKRFVLLEFVASDSYFLFKPYSGAWEACELLEEEIPHNSSSLPQSVW